MKPLEKFDFSNLNSIFSKDYLDGEICDLINPVENKEIFLEDLIYIDTDYVSCLEKDENLSYKNFLVMKSQNLKNNVDEIIFRFNIVDNPWLEIIYENNENNSFLSTILQNSQHYFQVSKKFHMWKIAEEVVRFFNLPNQDYHHNEINLLKYYTELKQKLCNLDDKEFKVENLIDFNYLENLLISDLKYKEKNKISYFRKNNYINEDTNTGNLIDKSELSEISEKNKINLYKKILNFEYFKILFDLSLIEHISPLKSTVLIDKAIIFLEDSIEKENIRFYDIVDKYKMFIDPNLSKEQKEESLCKMVVSTKNVSSVPINCGPLLIRSHLKFLSNHREALKALIEKVNQNKSEDLSHEELNKYFVDAYQALLNYEAYSEHETNSIKFNKTMNYLKIFLNYLIKIGDIYHQARIKYKKNGSNYLRILKKYPKEIIAKLFLKYNSEYEALKIAKMTKTDLIWVILEFTDYYKKSIINYNEFNNYFNDLLNAYESQKINVNKLENQLSNFENLYVKEEWVKGNPDKTFPLTMRILEFIYKLSYDSDSSTEEYNQFVPLFVSLYRFDFDSLSDEEQVKFWNLLIDKYSVVKIFNNYIKMIFTKFYFYKTFYQKNSSFKHLYEKINHISNNVKDDNEKGKSNKNSPEESEKIKDNSFSNNSGDSKNNFEQNSNKEKIEIQKKLFEKISNQNEYNNMLPKTFSFIPTNNEYMNKLNSNLKNYLSSKLNNKTNDYSMLFKENNMNKFIEKNNNSDINISKNYCFNII